MKEIVAYAPGRVEILGNHTDYNQGYVMAGAINFGVTLTGRATGEEIIRLSIYDEPRPLTVAPSIDALEALDRQQWYSYPCGVVRQFLETTSIPIPGFEAHFTSTLPAGAGLSSSAALEISTGRFLEVLTGQHLDPLDLAKIGCRAENEYVGMSCGLLDQISSIYGKEGQAIFIDFRSLDVRNISFPDNCELIVCHSGVKHALTGGEYNERREQCFSAAHKLGAQYLREIDSPALEKGAGKLTDLELRRARHIVGENERVQNGLEALGHGDAAAFGKLMFASHESSRINFENSTPELDALVQIAKSIDGIHGSRLTGGGFGGATVSLVEKSHARQAGEELVAAYSRRTGNTGQVYLCELSAGARIL